MGYLLDGDGSSWYKILKVRLMNSFTRLEVLSIICIVIVIYIVGVIY